MSSAGAKGVLSCGTSQILAPSPFMSVPGLISARSLILPSLSSSFPTLFPQIPQTLINTKYRYVSRLRQSVYHISFNRLTYVP